jgi:hypothetical protein
MTFRECDTCAAKTGSPTLCGGCIHNRKELGELKQLLDHLPAWRPVAEIESVMEPWTPELPSYYRWRGLIQMPKSATSNPWVHEGWAYWFKSRHANSVPVVRWACSHGLCTPEFFQPFPEPRTN